MALIKYYNLESQSWEDVSDLERNLQKHLLDEQRTRAILGTDVEDVAEAKMGNGDKDTLAMLLYDSGDFDVLYKNSWTISKGKKRWFRENVVPRVGTELVVRARPEDILELQDYLGTSGFEVVEARAVSKATYSFATKPHVESSSQAFAESLKEYMKKYPNTELIVKERKGTWGDQSGNYCSGLISGDVPIVLHLRKFLINSAPSYGTSIRKEESVTFAH